MACSVALRRAALTLAMIATGCAAPSPSSPPRAASTSPRVLWTSQIAPLPTPMPVKQIDPDTDVPPEDFANRRFAKPLSRESAFAILLNTDTFAGSYVGYDGSKSVQVEAFQTLLSRADALDVFHDLRKRARLPGQLYALCAFRLISPADYAREEPAFATSPDAVTEQWGCMPIDRPAGEIVRFDSPSTVRLKPGQTYDQWLALQTDRTRPVQIDISGGAIPDMFRSAR